MPATRGTKAICASRQSTMVNCRWELSVGRLVDRPRDGTCVQCHHEHAPEAGDRPVDSDLGTCTVISPHDRLEHAGGELGATLIP